MTPIERADAALAMELAKIERDVLVTGLTSEERRGIIRSIIVSTREPTDGMIEAGWDAGPDRAPSVYYTAMIDAALAEGA